MGTQTQRQVRCPGIQVSRETDMFSRAHNDSIFVDFPRAFVLSWKGPVASGNGGVIYARRRLRC